MSTPLLEVRGVSKRFGGLTANDDVSFTVEEGELVSIIGPNGAGKSTLFNCITGFYAPTVGKIVYRGRDITGFKADRVCRMGIARTFQIVQVIGDMTVMENAMTGAFLRSPRRRESARRAEEVLAFTHLLDKRDFIGAALTIADKKRLEVAMALATDPKLLMLDESMAGLTRVELGQIMGLLREVRKRGVTMVIVEHVMEAVMQLSDRVIVLNTGRKIVEGTPREVVQNPQVIQAYLGSVTVLEFDHVSVGYGDLTVIHDVSFKVEEGEVVSLVGSNGAGKSTILRTVAGLMHPKQGEIRLNGEPIHRTEPYDIVRKKRVAMVPEGRQLFGRLSVMDNLLMGAYSLQSQAEIDESLQSALSLFPILKDRRDQRAETLSGGEQQQLAIARGLMSRPTLLMLDEPSLGIMPKLVAEIFDTIHDIRKKGITVLLVEQNVFEALEVSDRAYVLQSGHVVLEGPGKELLDSNLVREAFLGSAGIV